VTRLRYERLRRNLSQSALASAAGLDTSDYGQLERGSHIPKAATLSRLLSRLGEALVVETSPRKRGRVPEYICARRRLNGTCANVLRMAVTEVNEAVLQAIEEHALTPQAIEQVVHLSERDEVAEQQAKLGREAKDVEKRIARLVDAIETGGDVPSLIAKLRDLEARRQAITVEGAALRPVPRLEPSVIENRLAEWRRLLRQSTTQGRTVLQRILRGRLTFTPQINRKTGEMVGYSFEGPTRFDRLFSGITISAPKHVDRNDRSGTAHIGPEDTFEGDYGRLLDRVYKNNAEGMASPTGHDRLYFERPIAA
jgi:transcriptional regulator with XRE-family HTH domain